jgi:hypothetical protein
VLLIHDSGNNDVFIAPRVEWACKATIRVSVNPSPISRQFIVGLDAFISIEFLICPFLQSLVLEFAGKPETLPQKVRQRVFIVFGKSNDVVEQG